MAPWFGWLTCRNPVGVDPLVDRPVQVAQVQVARVQVAQVQVAQVRRLLVLPLQLRVRKAHVQAQALVQAQWGNAQGVLASLVKVLARTPTWRVRTLA